MVRIIPLGESDFKTIIDKKCAYVDKTDFIQDTFRVINSLYTRPRRFGKTLNLSTLHYFYSIKEKENSYLFDGLKISEVEEAKQHQNQYPLIFLSFKDIARKDMDGVL